MIAVADRITTVFAREFAAAHRQGVRTIAVTTVSSLVAAIAARHLGASSLAIAPGFGTLDAAPVVSLSLLESGLGTASSPKGPIGDTFVAVSRGMVGVVVQPAQLDGNGAANLSRIGGTDANPQVALPGSRGLPDNSDSPSRVWYLVPRHSPRQLVAEVDFISGVAPSPGRLRKLMTDLGVFELAPGEGWHIEGLYPGVARDQVEEATGFPLTASDATPTIAEPTTEELAVLAEVDPEGIREIEFLGSEGQARASELIAAERAGWLQRRGETA